MVSAAIRLRAPASPPPRNLPALAFREKQPVLGRVLVIGHLLECASIQWMARCRPALPPQPPGAGGVDISDASWSLHDQPPARTSVMSTSTRNPDCSDLSGHHRSHGKENNGPGQHCSLKIIHRGCAGNAHAVRSHEKQGNLRGNPKGSTHEDIFGYGSLVRSRAKLRICFGIGIDVDGGHVHVPTRCESR
jgi:hypothetical protein